MKNKNTNFQISKRLWARTQIIRPDHTVFKLKPSMTDDLEKVSADFSRLDNDVLTSKELSKVLKPDDSDFQVLLKVKKLLEDKGYREEANNIGEAIKDYELAGYKKP